MGQTLVIEGTGVEVARVLASMPEQRFRAVALQVGSTASHESEAPLPPEASLQQSTSVEEWIREFRDWAAGHRRLARPLSDEAVSRETIYDGC